MRGYLVPDGVSEPGMIRVMAGGKEIFRGACDIVIPGIIEAGRHESGLVGFVLDSESIGDFRSVPDLRIYEDKSGFLLYRRNDPLRHIQRRVFRLETSFIAKTPYFQGIGPYFAYAQSNIEFYGQETVTQLFHLKNYPSVYFEGRVNMRNYERFLSEDLFSVASITQPFLNLAMTLLHLSGGNETEIHGFDEREFNALAPVFSYFANADAKQYDSIVRLIKAAPKQVLKALESPITARLASAVPGEPVSRKSVPKALDILSQFTVLLRDIDQHQTGEDISDMLGLESSAVPAMTIPKEALELQAKLSEIGTLHTLLESDLILYKYLENATKGSQ